MKLENIINGDKLNIRYTFKTDDITKGPIPHSTPYVDRKVYFDENGEVKELNAKISISEYKDGLKIILVADDDRLSEFGLSLPLNFMGKLNGGGWQNQYLLNSPYTSEGNTYKYCYLTNPNGKNLFIFPKGKCDGWKADYSPYCCGHFFVNLEFLASFDRAYGWNSNNTSLELYVFEVKDILEGIDKMCEVLNTCALTYEYSSVKIGAHLTLFVHGNCNRVVCNGEGYEPKNGKVTIKAQKYGLTSAIPYHGEDKGMEAVFFAYENIDKLFEKSVYAIDPATVKKYTDGNLCEHQCWQAAMLRYMQKNGANEKFMKMIEDALSIVMEENESKAVPRQTILKKPHGNSPEYAIFESFRIQEQLFGVTILTDAYKLTGDKRYLEYVTGSLNSVLDNNFDNGMIYTNAFNSEKEDYTTVCCLIIPFIDAALLLEKENPELSARYKNAAKLIVEYLYRRKSFHTETLETHLTEAEMEDGSISCTALSFLYYCAKIERVEKYVERAKQILDLHEPWMTSSPIAPAFRSSLRWWETFWEGDADGPYLCLGHPWTIWRAEADWWYYYLTKDDCYKVKAINGFMSNFSKIDKDGKSYSCLCLDYIKGGGFTEDAKQVTFEIRQGFPHAVDSGLSLYAWVRAYESILKGGVL